MFSHHSCLLQKSKPANGQIVEPAVTPEVVKTQEKAAKPAPSKATTKATEAKKSNTTSKKADTKSKTQDKKAAAVSVC